MVADLLRRLAQAQSKIDLHDVDRGARPSGVVRVEQARTRPPEIAYQFLQALKELGDRRALDVAIAFLAPFADGRMIGPAEEAWMCATCTDVLGTFATPESVAMLRRLLDHAEMRFRRNACDALGAAGDRAAVPWLEAKAKDRERQVTKAAAAAIKKLAT